jgi:hypothetical protein
MSHCKEDRASTLKPARYRPHGVETDADRYARVSTVDQNLALTEAGCERIFTEQMSGAVTDRPTLHDALEFARSGDTLIVWKLDRLPRSMKKPRCWTRRG